MRQFRTGGNTVTPSSSMVSGASEPLGPTNVTFQVPIGLFPRGEYLLMGRLSSNVAGNFDITVQTATAIGSGTLTSDIKIVSLPLTTSMANYVQPPLSLPTVDIPLNSSAFMQLNISTVSANRVYDEFWLFNSTIGAIVWVDCGTGSGSAGGSARRVFIEPPSVTTPRQTVRIGHSADRSDAYHPAGSVKSWDFPRFDPPQVNVLAVTPNANDAVVSLSGYARWHTNAAS
jgi:hypothetical protein